MPMIITFQECAECAAKPGSPELCNSCLHNRRIIEGYKEHLREEQKKCKCVPNVICEICCESKLFDVDSEPMITPKGDLKLVPGPKVEEPRKEPRKYPKRFPIDRLRVYAVAIDSEDSPGMRAAAERAGHEYDEDAWQDLVVTLEDKDGNRFEVARTTVQKDGMEGSWTRMAQLVCARSWGSETDDASVSCPMCLERGHGAEACRAPR